MRFPVFARRADPRVDRPIVRKNLNYLETQVHEGLADWVDPCDPACGIIAREYLPSGKAQAPDPVAVESLNTPRAELPGVKYVPPSSDSRPRLASVRAGWDWSIESINAAGINAAIPA